MNIMLPYISALVIALLTLILPFGQITIAYGETEETVEATSETKTTEAVKERLLNKEDKMKRMEEIRKGAKVRLDQRKETFKENLTKIKDEKKRVVLERMVGKFDTINAKWVENWKKVLEKLTSALDKIDARASELSASGTDITSYTTAASTARTKIDEAYAALEKQAANSYVFEVTTDAALKTEVKGVAGQFRTDAQAVHTVMKAARESVGQAFSVLKGLKKGGTNE